MEDCERKYKEAFNMAVLEHKSDNEAVRESIERIFPQLKESEDERIRKALISAINNICNGDEGLVTFNGFSKEQVLTWLEKQGEPADKCEGCNNAKGCVACVDGSEWAHIEEHNPAWGEEDERMRQYAISDLRLVRELVDDPNYFVDVGRVEKEISWLNSLKEKFVDFDKGFKVGFSAAKHNQWKPSDEQMERLKGIINSLPHQKVLYSLYQDLKKLKG